MDTFESLLEFEKKKHYNFFLPYYAEKNWKVIQDNLGKNSDWDVKLLIDGELQTIDEKARQKDYGDFLVEIVQDLKTGNRGWLFKPKDFYFYASWNDLSSEEPNSLYKIDANDLKDFVIINWKNLIDKMEISEKGWGTTLFTRISWQDLILLKVAEKLI